MPGFHPTYRGFDKYVGIPYSVDMGCSLEGGFDKGSGRKCSGGYLKPTPHQWELALPLYHSGVNCSGQAVGSCNGDIVEAPVNFSTLSDTYSAFAEEFIGNSSHDSSPFFLCALRPILSSSEILHLFSSKMELPVFSH